MEVDEDIKDPLLDLLSSGDLKEAKGILSRSAKEDLDQNSDQIIDFIFLQSDKKSVIDTQECLHIVANKMNPKLVILSILENLSRLDLNEMEHVAKLGSCLGPWAVAISRSTTDRLRNQFLTDCLQTLPKKLSKLKVPDIQGLDRDQRHQLQFNEELMALLRSVVAFTELLVKIVCCQDDMTNSLVAKIITSSLCHPLSKFHFEFEQADVDGNEWPEVMLVARKLVQNLQTVVKVDLISYILTELDESTDWMDHQGEDGRQLLASLAFVIHYDPELRQLLPMCYRPLHLLLTFLPLGLALATSDSEARVFKGLALLCMLLEKLDHHSLDSEFIQSSLCAKVVGVVVTCITSSESVEQRKQAFGLISSLYQRTTRSAQPAFLTMAMAHPDMPPGLRSELLKWLTAAFAQDMDADPGLPEFRSAGLQTTLAKMIKLNPDVKTWIWDRDYIMSAASSFGCMLRLDKANKTGIHQYQARFKATFAKPVSDWVTDSLAEAEMRLQLFSEAKTASAALPEDMDEDDEPRLRGSINTLHLIRFSLSRFDL